MKFDRKPCRWPRRHDFMEVLATDKPRFYCRHCMLVITPTEKVEQVNVP